MARRRWRIAEFDSPDRLREAARHVSDRGARIVEACTPYDVPGVSALIGRPRTKIPMFGFIGGLTGAILGYGIMWYVDAWSYPLNIGGRPNNSIPLYVFVTFETLVLCAAAAIFFGLFYLLGMPRYYHPLWEIPGFERASTDRFFLVVEPAPDRDAFADIAPLRVVDLEVDT
jgi:hypothetical protein